MSSFEHNEIKARIHHYLVSKTNFLEVKDTMQGDQMRAFVDHAIDKLCQETKLTITLEERLSLLQHPKNDAEDSQTASKHSKANLQQRSSYRDQLWAKAILN